MKTPSLLSVLLATSAMAALTATAARAQKVTCIQPANCTLQVTSDTARQYLTVRVTDAAGNPRRATVRFFLEKGAGTWTREVPTDSNGLATTIWQPTAPGAYPAELRVRAEVGPHLADVAGQTLQLTYTEPATSSIVLDAGNNQWWYEDRQLRAPVRVEIRGPTSAAECEATVVSFRAAGGTAAPDSANGTWEGRRAERCTAESWWQLPKVVGTNALRATLANGSNVTFLGHARRLPRIVVGVAAYRTHSFSTLSSSADTVRVERELPGTTTTIAYDSVTSTPKVTETAGTEAFNPIIGVDFPLHPQLQRVRASLFTTMTHPDENMFLGLSLPQLVRGVGQEAVGFDFHLALHVQRQKTLRDQSACEAAPSDASKCEDHHVLRYGLAIVGLTDTADLVSTLSSVFGIK